MVKSSDLYTLLLVLICFLHTAPGLNIQNLYLDFYSPQLNGDKYQMAHSRPYWWGGVVNLFRNVTTVLQFHWSMMSSDWLNAVTCQNKFMTPPYRHRRYIYIIQLILCACV